MHKRAIWGLAMLALSSCGEVPKSPNLNAQSLQAHFTLGHVGVITTGMAKGAYSVDVQSQDLATHLRSAVTSELSNFTGGHQYNLGIKVEAYTLANPSMPTVPQPKSVLMLTLSVWDDSHDPRPILAPATVVAVDGLYGTSIFVTKPQGSIDQRLAALCAKAAIEIERYLVKNSDFLQAMKDDFTLASGVLAPYPAEPVANVN